MRKLLLIGLFFIASNANSQRIKTRKIIEICDSIIKSKVGENLSQYFSITTGHIYTEKSKYSKPFLNKRRTTRLFKSIDILYHFAYPKIQGVRGAVWLNVDKNFNLIDTLDFDFIPKFVAENKPSEFITIDSAMTIIKLNVKPNDYKTSIPNLTYNYEIRQYTYTSTHDLTVILDYNGKDIGEYEIIEINAMTGSIVSVSKGYKGIRIR